MYTKDRQEERERDVPFSLSLVDLDLLSK